jgi:Rieske Fe-S protein
MLALAGRSSNKSDSAAGSTSASDTGATDTSAAATSAAASSAPASTPAAASSEASSPAAPTTSADDHSADAIVKLAAVPVGGSISAQLAGKPIVVSQQSAGKVTAFSAICTHMGCTVNSGGAQFHCPCHGSVYNAFTGAVVQGPAPKPLPPIAVKVSGDDIVPA